MTPDKAVNAISIIVLVFAFGYGSWHFGRFYGVHEERRRAEAEHIEVVRELHDEAASRDKVEPLPMWILAQDVKLLRKERNYYREKAFNWERIAADNTITERRKGR